MSVAKPGFTDGATIAIQSTRKVCLVI